jgi:polar amino acid transport system permease protein
MPVALFPEWVEPTASYMLKTGFVFTLKIAAISLVASTLIGVTLGTLITIRFRPLQWLIRLYIEVWRGLPILITVFIVFFALPALGIQVEVLGYTFDGRFAAWVAATIGLTLWGSAQVAEATRGAVQSIPREQHEAAAALGFGWVGRSFPRRSGGCCHRS